MSGITQIDVGKIRFTWKGDYDVNVSYEPRDVVKYSGTVYVCNLPNDINTLLTGPDQAGNIYWDVMVEGGEPFNLMSQDGDLLIKGADGVHRGLRIGNDGEVLTVSGGEPQWSNVLPAGTTITIQNKEYRYTSGKWLVPTGMTWAPGLYENYTPIRSDSKLRFEFGYTIERWGSSYDKITNVNMARSDVDGSNISYEIYRWQTTGHAGIYTNTWQHYEHEIESWGAGVTKRFGILMAAHNATQYRGYLHSTTWNNYDQSGQGTNAYPYIRFQEVVTL
jgi:hypothetical protein